MAGYKERLAARRSEQARRAKGPAGRGVTAPPRHVCDETCEHYRTPLEKELSAKIAALLKEVPAYHRANIEGVPWVDVRVLCSGATPIMAYYCCMKPGHTGKCFSSNKQVYFAPETYK